MTTRCVWRLNQDATCEHPATGEFFQGSEQAMRLDRFWRPLCDEHQRMIAGSTCASMLPLAEAAVWVVAIRGLRVEAAA